MGGQRSLCARRQSVAGRISYGLTEPQKFIKGMHPNHSISTSFGLLQRRIGFFSHHIVDHLIHPSGEPFVHKHGKLALACEY